MPIIYQYQADDLPIAAAVVNPVDDDSWWSGVQTCFASIALASLLATTSLSTAIAPTVWSQDEIPGSLSGQPDEDFWQNPVAPVPNTLRLFQQWPLDVQEPAGSLFGPNEDFWQNPVAPVPMTYIVPFGFGIDEDALIISAVKFVPWIQDDVG